MLQITLEIDGMRCGMCEAHLNDAIRAAHRPKRVTSSRKKGTCVILTEADIPDDVLQKTVSGTGYTLRAVKRSPAPERGLLCHFLHRKSS